jgi:hypothetical protein
LEVEVPAKIVENTQDAILSSATAAVGGTILKEVTALLKRLFARYYESQEELNKASEWQRLDKLFCDACDDYVSIATHNRHKTPGELFGWVKKKIKADAEAISLQHFSCDRRGYIDFKGNFGHPADTWCAMHHIGFMNLNAVFSVFRRNIDRAESVALGSVAIRIASGSTWNRQGLDHDNSTSKAGPQPSSVYPSVPLSEFEAMVGKLMVAARRQCPTKYLSKAEVLKIAVLLDEKNVPVRNNLERDAARGMAEYNQQHPTAAIKGWGKALGHPRFGRSVRKRFSRAEEKYKKESAAGSSAGTPGTTI